MATNEQNRFFQARSISFRLHIIIVLTVVLTGLGVSYVGYRVSTQLMDSTIRQNATRFASRLAQDFVRRDAPTDPDAIRNWLRSSLEFEPYIIRIDLYHLSKGSLTRLVTTSTSESQPVALDESAAIRDAKTLAVPLYQDRERYLKVVVPFIDPAGTKGCVTVLANFRQSDLVGGIHTRIAYFLVPGSALLSIFILHYFFTRLLIQRIDRLILSMNAARAGNLGNRAPTERQDEIGIIAQRYNEMMEEIEQASRERDQLLEEQKSFNVHLQEKVKEATAELSTANEKLRQTNEDLVETQRRLTQSERAAVVGQMAAVFAHEIGSPLSAISTHLQLMAEDSAVSDEARRRVALIQDQVSRITSYVEELLSETRATMAARPPIQLNKILQQLLLFLEQHLARHHVNVETHFSPDLPEIEANPHQIQQVFLNLLNNACDAMPGGGTVVIETKSYSDQSGAYVAVSVADNGVGIPEEKQGRIFEPFFTTKDLNRGTGLGLSIAAKIIRQHQGTIWLHSVPGAGAKFTIRFPVPVHSPAIRQEAPTGETIP
jgi:two-component system NtrC family sensor kinase